MDESFWSQYPANYRKEEIQHILSLLRRGECVSLIGMSGMGKSNLLGFLAYSTSLKVNQDPICVLVDCNRLPKLGTEEFFTLTSHELQAAFNTLVIDKDEAQRNSFDELNFYITSALKISKKPLALLLDGFDDLARSLDQPFFNQLRSLRDTCKFRLSFLLATRQPLDTITGIEKIREFEDLLISNQVWLQPLSEEDARWTVNLMEDRLGQPFDEETTQRLLLLSGHHPGLLKILAASWASGDPTNPSSWLKLNSVSRECRLIWEDLPESSRNTISDELFKDDILQHAGLVKNGRWFSPIFAAFLEGKSGNQLRLDRSTGEVYRGGIHLDIDLTAKEFDLLSYLLDNVGAICEKDDLIRAVWPEDKVFVEGIRDDSLAQLVRRLRVKIEPDPSTPIFLQTIPGRGYRLLQPD